MVIEGDLKAIFVLFQQNRVLLNIDDRVALLKKIVTMVV